MTKTKKAWLIATLSIAACILHAAVLYSPFNAYAYSSAFKVLLFLLFPFIYVKISRSGTFKGLLQEFSVKNANKQNLQRTCLLGLGVFTFIVVMFMLLRPFIDDAMVAEALAANSITRRNAFFVFIYIVLINAGLEQLFFRGFVFLSLYRMGFKVFAHVFSAALFSVYHIPILFHAVSPGILALCTLGLVAAGLIFNWLALWCKSLSGSLIVHVSANLALNLMIGVYFVFV